jgi:hypothetical protein
MTLSTSHNDSTPFDRPDDAPVTYLLVEATPGGCPECDRIDHRYIDLQPDGTSFNTCTCDEHRLLLDRGMSYVSPPIRLRPEDRIVSRAECWRSDCRAEFRGYATILFTITGLIVAFCHRGRYDDLGHRADVWRHEMAA